MRVFVTGSTGYVGSAIVQALVKGGHHVAGLYRATEKEHVVRELGATPIFGHFQDPETYQHFAAECDAVIHAGFESPEVDQLTVEALLSALVAEGEKKSFIYTSGVWVLGNTGPVAADERAPVDNPFSTVAWRPLIERQVLNGGNDQLVTAVVRPGLVYGGKRGLFASYFESAVKNGATTYIGDGSNHAGLIHRDDLGALYRLVVEKRAGGIFHGVDGLQPTIREIAVAASQAAGRSGAVQSWPLEAARQKLGTWIEAMTLDQRIAATRSFELGWKPSRQSFVQAATAAFGEWKE